MLTNNPKIIDLMYESAIKKLSTLKGITLQESREKISQMSFSQYLQLLEAGANITPPSGQTISPSGPTGTTGTSVAPGAQTAPSKVKAIWPGKGAPVEQGMTVGLKGPSGTPVPGEITQVDQAAKGVKVRNPTTGQEEWHSNDELQPFMAQSSTPGAPQQQQMAEDLARMKHLAGIAENASAGATGAGAIAVAPAAIGKMKKRQPMEESPPKEYTPKEPAKTIVGDTKPNQASGELSANLAARGKKTASRINNGFKK